MDTAKNLNELLVKLLEIATDLSRHQHVTQEPPALEELSSGSSAALEALDGGLAGIARRLLQEAKIRRRYVPGVASSDHFWPLVLDLYIHAVAGRKVSIGDACIASGVPATTGLRWIKELGANGVVERTPDPEDRRRVYVSLSAATFAALSDERGIARQSRRGRLTWSDAAQIPSPSAEPVSPFSLLPRGDPAGRIDVRSVPAVAPQCRGFAFRARNRPLPRDGAVLVE